MKNNTSNNINKKDHSKNKIRPSKQKIASAIKHMGEENSEDLREIASLEAEDIQPDTNKNWSEAQDRSEDLINETDPFIQETEKKAQNPQR